MAVEVGKYLVMLAYAEPGAKTGKWEVRNRIHGNFLGEIRWFGRWRQYAFFPAKDTVFNRGCLDDMAGFIRDRMAERATPKAEEISVRKYPGYPDDGGMGR